MEVIYRKRKYEVVGKEMPLPLMGGQEKYLLKGKNRVIRVCGNRVRIIKRAES